MKYYRLNDNENNGKIVRAEGRIHEIYEDGKWIRDTIMLRYFSDESPYYGCYEEVSKPVAMRSLT